MHTSPPSDLPPPLRDLSRLFRFTGSLSLLQNMQVNTLNLRCHSEGVFWRGLIPILLFAESNSSDNAADLALAALIGHYKCCIIRSVSYHHDRDDAVIDEASEFDGELKEPMEEATAVRNRIVVLEDSHCLSIQIINVMLPLPEKTINSTAKNHHRTTLILITIHPPDPSTHYSRTPATRPTNTFTLRLLQYEKHHIQLTSLSAYLSTLGGGYFLTHQLSTAYALAYRQCIVAQRRGDVDMEWRCRINMGYCCFYAAGRLEKGREVVRAVLTEVLQRLRRENNENNVNGVGDHVDNDIIDNGALLQNSTKNVTYSGLAYSLHDETNYNKLYNQTAIENKTADCNLTVVKNMCLSALWFADRLQEAEWKEQHNNRRFSSTHDDYKRIRIVHDRGS